MGGWWFWVAIVWTVLTAYAWIEWRIAMMMPPWDGDQ